MHIPSPSILKPVPRWTGKQLIGALLGHICRPPLAPLSLDGTTRTPQHAFGVSQNETCIVFRNGQLLCGVLDKSSIGASRLGLVHAVYELYGPQFAGKLLSSLGRLFTNFLQISGHTCGIEDLILNRSANKKRSELLDQAESDAERGLQEFLSIRKGATSKPGKKKDVGSIEAHLAQYSARNGAKGKVLLDRKMQGVVNKSASLVLKACLPDGLMSLFPRNNFSMMVITGAKGSSVNQSQISCHLGQQSLEGQRVPVMISGKTLPSFKAFDRRARAGGFIRDRFLTGVRPQEYYFHCMAGREGLVDTAVKTSRSGYLQRCLVKHLEELKLHYDMTVRDSSKNIVQFVYGDDGLDTVCSTLFKGKSDEIRFLGRNHQALVQKYSLDDDAAKHLDFSSGITQYSSIVKARSVMERMPENFDVSKDILELKKKDVLFARRKIRADLAWSQTNIQKGWQVVEILKVRKEEKTFKEKSFTYDIRYRCGFIEKKVPNCILSTDTKSKVPIFRLGIPDPSLGMFSPCKHIGSICEKIQDAIHKYTKENPDGIVGFDNKNVKVEENKLKMLIWMKYARSLACPGEAVGCVAAQSIGEPSTQMTLNTFHLAGHGGANVTLGIPRLREIIMTASKTLKTPTMLLPLIETSDKKAAERLVRRLGRVTLADLLHHEEGIVVTEKMAIGVSGSWERVYDIRLKFQDMVKILLAFGLSMSDVMATKKKFLAHINYQVKLEQRRSGETKSNLAHDAFSEFRSKVKTSGVESHISPHDTSSSAVDELFDGKEEDRDDNDSIEDGLKQKNDQSEINGYEDDSEEEATSLSGEEKMDEETDHYRNEKETDLMQISSIKNRAGDDMCFSLKFPTTARRLLMVQIIEASANLTTVQETEHIQNAYALECDVDGQNRPAVQTEGVNFHAMFALSSDVVDHKEIKSNDINQVLITLGVEGARNSIVLEIQSVFGAYGIDVNPRHLSLVADFMTRSGGFSPMNRIGMTNNTSPFLQMSFETTCSFLTRAACEGLKDTMESSSASVVLGQIPRIGTGAFDLMVPLK
jgi:DNA-directed RNA polymerase I subunit RPA1